MNEIFRKEDIGDAAEYYSRLHGSGWKNEFEFRGPTLLVKQRMILKELAVIENLKGKSILDVGCGDYSMLKGINRRWGAVNLYGADIVDYSFNIKKGDFEVESRVFDVCKDVWEGRSFDLILCLDVLEHLKDDINALANIRQMLEPGGMLVLHVPFSMKYWSAHDESVGHFRRYSADEIAAKLTGAGFNDVELKTYGYPFQCLYYHLFLSRVTPERTQRKKTAADRLATGILYNVFRLDDFFVDEKCRKGFSIIGKARC